MQYLVFSAILFLPVSLSLADCWTQEESDIKFGNGSETILRNGTGCFFLKFDGTLKEHQITVNVTSILNVKMAIKKDSNSSRNESISDAEDGSIVIKIHELNLPPIIWKIDQNTTWSNESYLSQTSNVKIHIKGSGMAVDLMFSYEEVKYDILKMQFRNNSGRIEIEPQKNFEDTYRPNTVHFYQLNESTATSKTSTLLMLNNPFIDTTMGEFLLIGAGEKLSGGPSPLFILQPQLNSTYFVDDTRLYIIYVSNSTRMKREVKIQVTYMGMKSSQNENPLDDLKSRQICFCNEAHLNETDKFEEEFKNFLTCTGKFSENCTNKEENRMSPNELSVLVPQANNASSAKSISIQVKSHGKAIFNWKELEELIERFNNNAEYQVCECSPSNHYNKKQNLIMYLLVPAFGVFFLLIFAWKQNFFQSCMFQKKGKLPDEQSSAVAVEPNLYEPTHTVPKIVEISDEGRRRTLVPMNSNSDEVHGSATNMINTTTIPTTSTEADRTSGLFGIQRSNHGSSTQRLIQKEGELNTFHTSEIQTNGSEHVYDSVSSGRSVEETEL